MAPALALAHTTLYMNSAVTPGNPVEIKAEEMPRVLSHHLGVAPAAVSGRGCGQKESAGLWSHLPEDGATYDADAMFDRPSAGGVMLTFHGLQEEPGLFGDRLRPTHKLPTSVSSASLDALAQLYESASRGVHAVAEALYEAAGSATTDALARFDTELAALRALATGTKPVDLDQVYQLRMSALADIRSEYGEGSLTFRNAKEQLREVMGQLTERVMHNALPIAVLHTDDAPITRRAMRPDAALLAPFTQVGGKLPRPDGVVLRAAACHTTPEELDTATSHCSGHGTPVESRKGGQKCWRCACQRTKVGNRTVTWGGASCEKEDVSSLTLLVISTVLMLFVAIVASISLLFNEGKRELPGTLASLSPAS